MTAPALHFENASSEIVLKAYAAETGRTLLFSPDVPKATISLHSQTSLSRREYLQAIQTVLSMNGIALIAIPGEKFLKVVPVAGLRTRAPKTLFDEPAAGANPEDGSLISQMVQLKYITIDEARTAIESFKRAEGQIQLFERKNSILITDSSDNVNRMMEIIRYIDQPRPAREQVNVRTICFAKAANVKQRLEEIVNESQKNQQAAKESPLAKASGAPGIVRTATSLPIPSASKPSIANNPIVEALMDEAERGVIRGKVQIIADERTNRLIIITEPENMIFFDRIITVLDVETTPDVSVDVFRLEYADAVEVADMLNQLIGNAKTEQTKGAATAASANAATGKPGETPKSENLASFSERVQQAAGSSATGETGKSKVGELSKDNIKILANKRTNAVIVMASPSDIAAIREIIKSMDIMLSQVLIETVVLEVDLNKELTTGISWVQTAVQNTHGGLWAGSGGGGGSVQSPAKYLASMATNAATTAASGLMYYFNLPGIDINAVVQASSTDSRTKVLTSPVLLTQDNKEATIQSTELVYLNNGQTEVGTTSSGVPIYNNNISQKDIGLTVKVTPRINLKGMVVLHIDEKFQNQNGVQAVPQTDSTGQTTVQNWPTIATRELTADIAMRNGETAILGGLVTTTTSKSGTKVPLLGDIPFIGRYLFGSTDDTENRTELLVFLTPYVLDTQDSMEAEARRRKDYLQAPGVWNKGWSGSALADETIVQKINREKAEHAAALAKEQSERAQQGLAPIVVRGDSGTIPVTVTTNVVAPSTSTPPPAPGGKAGK